MKLDMIRVKVPERFLEWEHTVEERLLVEPADDVRSVDAPTALRLPGVLVLDYNRAAQEVGWTLGQFLSFLVVQGAMRVVEKGGRV